MKHLKNYESYQVNEGWKENILVGLLSLFGTYAMGQKKSPDIIHGKAKTESSMKSMLKQGWSLDSVDVDTLYSKIIKSDPETEIIATRLMLDKDQYFPSGKFVLTQEMKSSIDSALVEILSNNGVLLKIEIESSTDKQGLSQGLQNELKGLGYSPDNKGLSKARCESVSKFVQELGVEDSLISVNQLFEKGEMEVEQSARYVAVDFYYVIVPDEVKPSDDSDDFNVKKTYYLSKEKSPGKGIKLSHKGSRTKTKKFKPNKNKINIKSVKCPSWD